MRRLIRTIVLASVLAFTIQPSAKAEVVSATYWQNLPTAIRQHNEQIWYSTALWNDIVRWNEAYKEASIKAAKQKATPKTVRPQPKVESDPVTQSGDRFDRLANCESSMRQDAVGGGGLYLSYFQWLPSTHIAAGGDGNPLDDSYSEQKADAQHLAEITDPATQWPECWPKSQGG